MYTDIQRNRNLYLFESLFFILLGIGAIAAPALFTYSIEILVGCIFLVGGVVKGFRSLKTLNGSALMGSLLMSVVSIILGVLLLTYPITGIIALTILVAILFSIEGIVQLFLGFQMRDLQGWGWIVFSGLVSLFLAGLIWSEMPGSAAWVIGLLVGINLLIFGISQLILVIGAPKTP